MFTSVCDSLVLAAHSLSLALALASFTSIFAFTSCHWHHRALTPLACLPPPFQAMAYLHSLKVVRLTFVHVSIHACRMHPLYMIHNGSRSLHLHLCCAHVSASCQSVMTTLSTLPP